VVLNCWVTATKVRRCAVYTRKSSEEGLEQEYSLRARGPMSSDLLRHLARGDELLLLPAVEVRSSVANIAAT
jgi:hypothetical protein